MVVLWILHRDPRRGISLRAGCSLHSVSAVLVLPQVEVGNMTTFAIWSCRFLIVVGAVAVWCLLGLLASKFCAFNDAKYSQVKDGPGREPR